MLTEMQGSRYEFITSESIERNSVMSDPFDMVFSLAQPLEPLSDDQLMTRLPFDPCCLL